MPEAQIAAQPVPILPTPRYAWVVSKHVNNYLNPQSATGESAVTFGGSFFT
jgi:hypothetical protein